MAVYSLFTSFPKFLISPLRKLTSQSTHALKVSTESLARLRKATGYPILKCRQALVECENDLGMAETWLAEQAEREGWAKVEQLHQRRTAHGLIAVKTETNFGVMVEVNCETDFVARNESFQDLVGMVTQSFFTHYKQKDLSFTESIAMQEADSNTLTSLSTPGSATVGEQVAKTVGRLSEKISIHRGIALRSSQSLVVGYSHGNIPRSPNLLCTVGTYGTLVAVKGSENEEALRKLGSRVAMQVVGTNPKGLEPPDGSEVITKEDWLLKQQFLFDSSITVEALLETHGARIEGFVRYSCGEN